MGSHKDLRVVLADEHQELVKAGKISADGTMSMDDAIGAAAKSQKETFPESRCSEDCIRAQLEGYYDQCKNANPNMLDEQAKRITPEQVGSFGD
ncbi:MAG: hypothetical protein ABW101_01520 [Candidatus Thiodiazotropha sp.]